MNKAKSDPPDDDRPVSGRNPGNGVAGNRHYRKGANH